MRTIPYIYSINGSDSTGQSGIGADIQTIAALGGHALTAITCVEDYALPSEVVLKQVEEVISTFHPKAIKVGLVTDSKTVRLLRDEVIACRRLVVAPGIFDSDGRQMVNDNVIETIAHYLVPEALLLMLRCRDAEKLLAIDIKTDDDMIEAAKRLHKMGAEWVLLRGARHIKGRLTALLYGQNKTQFFKDTVNRMVPEKNDKPINFREEIAREQESLYPEEEQEPESAEEEDGE